jgi:hypothetical protein
MSSKGGGLANTDRNRHPYGGAEDCFNRTVTD